MDFKLDDFVKVVGTNGDYRYGYINDVLQEGYEICVCLQEEGASKIAYDAESGGKTPADWDKMLTKAEKRLVPLLANGLETKSIAISLGISPITVRSHMRMLRLKLQLDNNDQLAAFAEGLQMFHSIKEEIDAKRTSG